MSDEPFITLGNATVSIGGRWSGEALDFTVSEVDPPRPQLTVIEGEGNGKGIKLPRSAVRVIDGGKS